jgi:hypothetical protein
LLTECFDTRFSDFIKAQMKEKLFVCLLGAGPLFHSTAAYTNRVHTDFLVVNSNERKEIGAHIDGWGPWTTWLTGCNVPFRSEPAKAEDDGCDEEADGKKARANRAAGREVEVEAPRNYDNGYEYKCEEQEVHI